MKNLPLLAAMIALVGLGGCKEEEPEDHGIVRIEIAPDGGDVDMFSGTTRVEIQVQYELCLQEFYTKSKVGYSQDGPQGAPIFADWVDRLCDSGAYDRIADCEVTSITQTIQEPDIYRLSASLKINDPSSLAYRELNIGPVPVPEFAACDGTSASVELNQSGMQGYASDDTPLWVISGLPVPNSAQVGQGAALKITTGRSSQNEKP